jgi:hypothetical protein
MPVSGDVERQEELRRKWIREHLQQRRRSRLMGWIYTILFSIFLVALCLIAFSFVQ